MRKSRKTKLFLLFLLLLLFLGAVFVFAQKPLEVEYPAVPGIGRPITTKTPLQSYIIYLFNLVIIIAGVVVFALFVYGGVRYLTSAGKPAAQKDAKDQIFAGILGLIIVLFSYLILSTVSPEFVTIRGPKLFPGPPPGAPGPSQPGLAAMTYVEIPIGGLVENLFKKRVGCYDYEADLNNPPFLTNQNRLDCIKWLSWAIKKRAEVVADAIKDLSELYKCSNCCSMADTDTSACGPGCGATAEACDNGCKAKCCTFDELCSAIGCRGSICMDGNTPCDYTSPVVQIKVAAINEAARKLRLEMGLFPLFEELKKPANIGTLVANEDTKNLIKDLLVGPPDPIKLKKVLKIKEVFEDIITTEEYREAFLADKNAAKTLMRIVALEPWGLLRNEIAINEIAWAGTATTTPNDEWIELYNNTKGAIDFTNWKLVIGSATITLSGTIPAQGFYLLEKDSDLVATGTDPDLTADLIYSESLDDNGEKLELYDEFGNLVDSVNCATGWFAGTTTTSTVYTMERMESTREGSKSGIWATNFAFKALPGEKVEEYINGTSRIGTPIYGTPKARNSVGVRIISYGSFEEMREKLKEELGKPDRQEEIIYIFRKDKNLERLLNSAGSQNAVWNILVGNDERLKDFLGKEEVLRILVEDPANLNALLSDSHASSTFKALLKMDDLTFNTLVANLNEYQTNLKLINEFKKDLRWIDLARFLMMGCANEATSYDQMKGISATQDIKIEYVTEWLENINTMISVKISEGPPPEYMSIYDPATFYCHKLLW